MSEMQMVGDSFRLGYRAQRHWDGAMAGAFFCGELGAGLFLAAMVLEVVPGMLLGLLLTGVGKPILHFAHLGAPGKSWRAILRPDRSWTSRGLIAIVVFCGAGLLHTVNAATGDVIPFDRAWQVLAGAAALVVLTYQGFAMSHSTAIALWSTAMMPIAGLLYGLAGGVIVSLLLRSGAAGPLLMVAQGLLLAVGVMLFCLLYAAQHGSPGGRLSAELLFRGRYARWFHGVVVAVGLVLPTLAFWLGGGGPINLAIAAAGVLAGFLAFRILVFKAGVYEPVMDFSALLGDSGKAIP
ncbi:MAG: dimethyl sulfoxide reductase anchor subunit [Alphaproteobacteria bacterium]|jgi:formate-dependent nitrite reductase membrane component NrfD|nr:dimethyl sulfoxide reductase anchor subunit [Alphaproteobacteria bacterium]MDP6567956.1 dimethyl sulfoxide reductase anchor subunit [Alphaproteobacteria bacterium]MDP6812366.1 dimethyl sulfoxide reductase anchor subunit [Alphaproteobacteria bacterium]